MELNLITALGKSRLLDGLAKEVEVGEELSSLDVGGAPYKADSQRSERETVVLRINAKDHLHSHPSQVSLGPFSPSESTEKPLEP